MMKPTHPSIESIEVIPMNKESIFEEPYSEDEIFGCSLSYDEWAMKVAPRITTHESKKADDVWYGFGLDYLKETDQIAAKFKGFMFGPTAKYGKHVLMAKSKKAKSIEEILEQDFSKCFLYVIGGRHVQYCTHPAPFDVPKEELEDYFIEQYEYIIRYAEIE